MSEPPVREIHLSRKQLAFGVISAVGVSVIVFLLGVSVGRGVIATSAGSVAALDRGAAADAGDAAARLAASDASDRTGSSAGSAGAGANSIPMKFAEPPAPPPEMPPAKADPPVKQDVPVKPDAPAKPDESSVTKTPAPKAAPAAVAPHAAAKPETQKPAPATTASHADWVVQVESFRSKENADKFVTSLKASGYAAFELSPQPGGSIYYRVQIGPFADRQEADKVASRLIKEGKKPSVIR
jgi:cell division septation protein DedD